MWVHAPPTPFEVTMRFHAPLPSLLSAALVSVVAFVGCAAPASSEDSSTGSEAALSSSEHLERSRIEVAAKNTRTHDGGDLCVIDQSHLRISYENATLPAGTKIALHIGESRYDQYFIGDGFGWSDGRKVEWMSVRDLAMTAAGDKWTVETDVDGFARMHNTSDGSFGSEAFPPEFQFVFRLELPDGREIWDDRLHQNYEARMSSDACPGYVDMAPLASWGPF
jgi:hypothetical protein